MVSSLLEDRLEEIETDPAFQTMMANSAADVKAGRVIRHQEVVRRSRARTPRVKGGEVENCLGGFRLGSI